VRSTTKKIHTEGIDFVKMEIQQAENYPGTNVRGKRLLGKKKRLGNSSLL